VARRPEGREEAAGAIDGQPELAGEALQSATELGFPNQKLPEREEGEGNASPASEWPKSFPRKASDGAAIDGTFGARGSDPREHRNAREKAEDGEEDEARSPTRRRRTKTTRTAGFARKSRRPGGAFSLRAHGREEKRGEGNWGVEGGARLAAHYLSGRGVEERILGERGAA